MVIMNDFTKKENNKEHDKNPIYEASFEDAISATEFGKFNYLLIFISIPCGWAAMMDSTTMSYVIPAANCDLDLNLQKKGMLNAITYFGMISSALLWGFLADTLGRKRILVAGFFIDGFFVTLAGLAQSYEMLLVAKYFTGFIINGPFAALTTAVSEFHAAKYRTRLVMTLGVIFNFGQLIIPGLAWLVVPRTMDFDLFDGYLKLHSWNFFILVCALPSLISSLAHCFLPESPKFLMTVGRNDDALEVFKKVYSLNTGLSPDTFPIKSLVDETKLNLGGKHGGTVTANRTKIQALNEGWQQITPLFFPPHVLKMLLSSTIQFAFIMGSNTIRLWLPQMFTAINDYQTSHPNESASFCTMLGTITPNQNTAELTECVVNTLTDFVYINSMVVSFTAIVGYTLISIFINKLGKKPTMIALGMAGGICSACMSVAYNATTTVALSAMTHTFISICCNLGICTVVDTFPTSLRAIAVSITLMMGRIGAMLGNIVFPYLLELGCLPPFLLIGGILICCSLLVIMLPKTDMKALK